MNILDKDALAKHIIEFINESKNPALFAGAGVGVRAGAPTWNEFLLYLADVARMYDQLSSDLITSRANSRNYLEAAIVYKSCPEIPEGEKYKKLAEPFIDLPKYKKLNALLSMPFFAVFTTNYDRSIHDSYASVIGKSPKTVELGDPTMSQGPFLNEFYVARIHGRSEVPNTIVLTSDDYKELETNYVYLDYMRHILTKYSCLFIGFSFVDPAIKNVLKVIENRLSPNFPKLHCAILPSSAESDLGNELKKFNIDVIYYELNKKHKTLWEAIKIASRSYTQKEKTEKPTAIIPLEDVMRFISTSYARVKLDKDLHPLRDLVIDGIVLDILARAGDIGLERKDIELEIRSILSLPCDASELLITQRIESLSGRGWCTVEGKNIKLSYEIEGILDDDIDILIEGINHRLEVREGDWTIPQSRTILSSIIEEILIIRGWDLGAHFAGANDGDLPNILQTIHKVIEKNGSLISKTHTDGLILACFDLFQNPDESESEILAELGRAAYALQLVINSPCSIIAQKLVLPENIYLDASFLMPAIVEGHPFRTVYIDVMNRIKEAAVESDVPVDFIVANAFLNEIIAHREISKREILSMGLENKKTLSKHLLYSRSENINIYISAYAHWLEKNKGGSYSEFLNQVAPYNSEDELSKYLADLGIRTKKLSFSPEELIEYHKVKRSLTEAYALDTKPWYRKHEILIEHEARQLTQINFDVRHGKKSLFITSDLRLKRLATDSVPGKPGINLITRRGLVQLIDLLIGFRGDPKVSVRLFWGSVVTDETLLIREYLIKIALNYKDEAMTMALSDVLQTVVPKSVDEAKSRKISLFPGGSTQDKIKTARFLEDVEDKFYERMAAVVKKRYPEEFNLAKELKINHIEEQIIKIQLILSNLDSILNKSTSTMEKERINSDISQLKLSLSDYKNNLSEIRSEND